MTRFFPILALCTSACLAPVEDLPLGSLDAGSTDGSVDGGSIDGGSDAGLPPGDGGTLTPFVCRPGAWCWQSPLPQGAALNSVFVVDANEAWAVGDFGATMRLRNGTWTPMEPITTAGLHDLSGSGPNDLWAIGRTPGLSDSTYELVHFDGTRWSVVPHGSNPVVLDVAATVPGETWLLTSARTTTIPSQLLRWNGSSFVPAPALPAGLEVESVCVRAANEVWVSVSDSSNSWPIALYKYDGTSWSLVHRLTATGQRFNSRVGCPAQGAAVVQVFEFNSGTDQFLNVRNGVVSLSNAPDYGTMVVSPHGDVFSFDGSRALKWTPSGWVDTFSLGPNQSVYSVEFDLVGGVGWLAEGTPQLSSWTGAGFAPQGTLEKSLSVFVSPRGNTPLDPIAAFGGERWAYRTNSTWTFADNPIVPGSSDRFSVNAAKSEDNGDAWLVGNHIFRFEASSRTLTPIVTAQRGDFNAIDGSPSTGYWAVGEQGVVRHTQGVAWVNAAGLPSMVDSVPTSNMSFTAVDVLAANDVMILGNDPAGGAFISAFFRWDGSTWTVTSSYGETLTQFDRDPLGNVYVFEGNDLKKRAPGATMFTTLGPLGDVSPSRLKVWGVDDVEVVAADSMGVEFLRWDSDRQAFSREGLKLHFNGARDIVPGTPTSGGSETFWALGAWGSVLRYEPL